MRVAADSRPGVRELPTDTPCLFILPMVSASSYSSSSSCPDFFFPRSRNNFVKSARRRRNDEGGTTALRGDCIRPSSRVLTPYTPSLALNPFLFPSHVSHPRRLSFTLNGIVAHAPGVSFLSTLDVRVLSVLSLSVSPSLSPFPSSSPSRARDLFRIRSSCASRSARSLRSRLFGRRIDASGHGGRDSRASVRSHARTLARSQPSSSSSSSGRLRIRVAGVSRDKRNEQAGSTEGKGTLEDVSPFSLLQSRRNPARAGSNYGELTYLPQRGGLCSFDRRRARSCEKRPES